jgi:hypothetical protein
MENIIIQISIGILSELIKIGIFKLFRKKKIKPANSTLNSPPTGLKIQINKPKSIVKT